MAHTILRLPEVIARTGLSRSSIYLRIANGGFPHSVSLGGRAVGWVEHDIEAWLDEKIASSRAGASCPSA
jgi:prophage regulatory protein